MLTSRLDAYISRYGNFGAHDNDDNDNDTTDYFTPCACTRANMKKVLLYSRRIWQELNLADWPQPARTKILVNFNLADGQVHAPNLLHAHACLRSFRGVARIYREGGLSMKKECARSVRKIFG